MHTMARVKNLTLAEGDSPEPIARAIGEAQVVAAADRLVANTDEEADQLVDLYDADPGQVVTVPPGVDLGLFSPGPRPPTCPRSSRRHRACWSTTSTPVRSRG
jgi:D-inositol-3-phosphate glycosyltransferase